MQSMKLEGLNLGNKHWLYFIAIFLQQSRSVAYISSKVKTYIPSGCKIYEHQIF